MANIAVTLTDLLAERRESGSPGRTIPRVVARGDGWSVADVLCTSGPRDRPFEERHDRYAIAVVVAGTFLYRSPTGRGVMTPGSLLLGKGLWRGGDVAVIDDGIVNGSATLVDRLSGIVRRMQTGDRKSVV